MATASSLLILAVLVCCASVFKLPELFPRCTGHRLALSIPKRTLLNWIFLLTPRLAESLATKRNVLRWNYVVCCGNMRSMSCIMIEWTGHSNASGVELHKAQSSITLMFKMTRHKEPSQEFFFLSKAVRTVCQELIQESILFLTTAIACLQPDAMYAHRQKVNFDGNTVSDSGEV